MSGSGRVGLKPHNYPRMSARLIPTEVYESYWRFAAERLAVYYRRLNGSAGPLTSDEIISAYRFTNTYRAADRVSQYLIREVQYRADRSQAPSEVFFRTILFKIFNSINTWRELERNLGSISWQSADLSAISALLDRLINANVRIYSAAYIMPSPAFGHKRKHANHLELLSRMMNDGLPGRIERARSLKSVYEAIREYPGLGPFLAFQYTIDLNYSSLLSFDEKDFVVAGPGALDGIAKCFHNGGEVEPSLVIQEMVDRQEGEFERLGLDFPGLFGRRLQPIDCQNLFCEISKYARVAHPNVIGVSGRTRIKQHYRREMNSTMELPFFPPKWGLNVKIEEQLELYSNAKIQFELGLA